MRKPERRTNLFINFLLIVLISDRISGKNLFVHSPKDTEVTNDEPANGVAQYRPVGSEEEEEITSGGATATTNIRLPKLNAQNYDASSAKRSAGEIEGSQHAERFKQRRSPFGIVYNQGKPIGILEPISRMYEYVDYKNKDGEEDERLVKRSNEESFQEPGISAKRSPQENGKYASILTSFKIGNRVKMKQFGDDVPLSSERKRERGPNKRQVDQGENLAVIEDNLKEIMDDLGLSGDSISKRDLGEKRENEDEDLDTGANKISLTKETHSERNKKENCPGKTFGAGVKLHRTEGVGGDEQSYEGEIKSKSKKKISDYKAEGESYVRKKRQQKSEDIVKGLETSGELTVSGNKSPLASSAETESKHKSKLDKDEKRDKQAAEDQEYEKRMQRNIETKITAIKDEVKREIKALQNNKDETKTKGATKVRAIREVTKVGDENRNVREAGDSRLEVTRNGESREVKVKATEDSRGDVRAETRDAREAGETRDAREAGETRNAREAGETRDARESGETRDAREAEETRDAREAGETRDAREAEETRDAREAGETREAREAGETVDAPEAVETGQAVKVAEEDDEVKNGRVSRNAASARDEKISRGDDVSRDSRSSNDVRASRDATIARDSNVAGGESQISRDVRLTRNAGVSRDAASDSVLSESRIPADSGISSDSEIEPSLSRPSRQANEMKGNDVKDTKDEKVSKESKREDANKSRKKRNLLDETERYLEPSLLTHDALQPHVRKRRRIEDADEPPSRVTWNEVSEESGINKREQHNPKNYEFEYNARVKRDDMKTDSSANEKQVEGHKGFRDVQNLNVAVKREITRAPVTGASEHKSADAANNHGVAINKRNDLDPLKLEKLVSESASLTESVKNERGARSGDQTVEVELHTASKAALDAAKSKKREKSRENSAFVEETDHDEQKRSIDLNFGELKSKNNIVREARSSSEDKAIEPSLSLEDMQRLDDENTSKRKRRQADYYYYRNKRNDYQEPNNMQFKTYRGDEEEADDESDEFDEDNFDDRTALVRKRAVRPSYEEFDDYEPRDAHLNKRDAILRKYVDTYDNPNYLYNRAALRKKRQTFNEQTLQPMMLRHLAAARERSAINAENRFKRLDDENEAKNGKSVKDQTIADLSEADIFGGLPQSYEGELTRFKRVKRDDTGFGPDGKIKT